MIKKINMFFLVSLSLQMHAMQKPNNGEKPPIKITAHPQFQIFAERDSDDDWFDPAENPDAISSAKLNRFKTGEQTPAPAYANVNNVLQTLKEKPDGTGYDSDEIPSIINFLQNPSEKTDI